MENRRKGQLLTPQSRIPSPCYGCGERTSVCHAGCGRYAEYRDLLATATDLVNREKEIDGYTITSVHKSREMHRKAMNAERR